MEIRRLAGDIAEGGRGGTRAGHGRDTGGSHPGQKNATSNDFTGDIDDVAVWSEVPGMAQIRTLASSARPLPSPASQVLACHALNNASGSGDFPHAVTARHPGDFSTGDGLDPDGDFLSDAIAGVFTFRLPYGPHPATASPGGASGKLTAGSPPPPQPGAPWLSPPRCPRRRARAPHPSAGVP